MLFIAMLLVVGVLLEPAHGSASRSHHVMLSWWRWVCRWSSSPSSAPAVQETHLGEVASVRMLEGKQRYRAKPS